MTMLWNVTCKCAGKSGKSLKLLLQMSDFKAKMHQIRFRLGLRPRPHWGSLQHSPRPPSWIYGVSYLMPVLLSFVVKLLNIRGVCRWGTWGTCPQTVLFDVSFPEKVLKIVATRCEIFSLKIYQIPFGGRALPAPLGELKHSPDPLAAIRGPTSKWREREGKEGEEGGPTSKGRGREGRGGEGKVRGERRERGRRRWEGIAPPFWNPKYATELD